MQKNTFQHVALICGITTVCVALFVNAISLSENIFPFNLVEVKRGSYQKRTIQTVPADAAVIFSVDTFQKQSKLVASVGNQEFNPEYVSVDLVDPLGNSITPDFSIKDNNININQQLGNAFVPGVYTANIRYQNPQTTQRSVTTQEFAWGVLAMNADTDVYTPGQMGQIAFGVLDDAGAIVCDAELNLTVISPSGEKLLLATSDNSIVTTGTCGIKKGGLIDPDYETYLTFAEIGTYTLELSAQTENGTRIMTQEISVKNNVPYSIKRTAATRLWPEAPSTMDIEITFHKSFIGTITDIVPAGFTVLSATPHANASASLDTTGSVFWNGTWSAGEVVTFSYSYDAPDISPEFYLLGPLQIGSYQEQRAWQIANDDTSTKFPSSGDDGTIRDANWGNPGNITADDNSYASVSLWGRAGDDESNDLYASNFGFAIPDGATIDGIEVAIGKYYVKTGNNGGSSLPAQDYVVQLLIDGSPSGTNKSAGLDIAENTEAESTYGGASDTWGLSPTVSQVNDATFGVAYAAIQPGGSGDESDVFVDYMSMTVYYSLPYAPYNLSGTVYTDEGVTNIGAGKLVTASVDGAAASATGSTNASGQYTLNDVQLSTGSVLTVYLEDETEDAVTVTLFSGLDMTGLDLYQNRLILRSDDGATALTNTNLATADNSGDTDITNTFTVSSTDLHVGGGKELYIWTGDTFTPGGKVFADDIEVLGTMSMETNSLLSSGSIVANSGTFTTSTGIHLQSIDDNEVLNMGTNNVTGSIILQSGLIGYWKLDEGDGTVVKDSSYYGYDGTLNFTGTGGWTTNTSSKIQFYNPHALEFDGSNDYVSVTGFVPSEVIGNGNAASIAYWVKPQSLEQEMHVGNSVNIPRFYAEQFARTGTLYAHWGFGTENNSATSNAALTIGSWNFVAVTYDGNIARTYLDGALTDTDTIGAQDFANGTLQFGKQLTSSFYFDGSLDDIRIYDRALNNSEVAALAAGNQGSGSGRYVLGSALNLDGDLRIYNSTLDVSSGNNYQINIAGDWVNYGNFTKQSGTVVFDGASQALSGSTVFNNFTKSVTTADTMTFDWKGRQSISGALVLNGAADNLLTLISSNTGSGWNILLDEDAGTQSTVSYLNVTDSDARGGQLLVCWLYSEGCVDGGNNLNWIFYVTGTGSVTGSVWVDTNGDGVKDGGETTGLSSVVVSLSGQTASGQSLSVADQTTDGSGDYTFADVVRSDESGYTVSIDSGIPAGYLKTSFTSTGGNILGTGQTLVVNFGYVLASSISGSVFVDLDQDGVIDGGETDVLSGATVTISGTSASGNTVVGTTTTNNNGVYAFRNLGPSDGEYTVTVTSVTTGYSAKLYSSSGITISQGATEIMSANFGYYWYGTLSGAVFLDLNANGIQDAGDTSGVSGVSISLSGTTGTGAGLSLATTTTSTGAFNFYNVPISTGNYTVSMTVPSGYSGTTLTSISRSISLGTHADSVLFGLVQGVNITGTVYTDEGITPIGSNKVVGLSVNGGALSASGATDAGGQYTIESFKAFQGTVLTLFLNDEPEDAVTVTISSGSTMTGVHLYQDHLVLQHETGGTLTNAYLAIADDSGDADITNTITSASAAAVTIYSGATVIVGTGTTFNPGGTFTAGNTTLYGTVTAADALSTQDLTVVGTLTTSSTLATRSLRVAGTLSAGGAVTSSGATVQGTLTTNGNTLAINRLTSSGTLTLGASTVTVRGSWFTSDATLTTSGNIHLIGTGSTYIFSPGTGSLQNITTSGSYSLGSSVDINGYYTLSGGSLDVSSNNYRMTVAGNWHNAAGSGAFVAQSGSVVLDGYGQDQTITGSTRFNKLTKTGSVAATLTFDASNRQYVSGSLVLKGEADALLSIRSTSSGSQAPLALIGSGTYRQDFEYLDVKDSDAGSGVLLLCLAIENSCVDSGNTTNWLLAAQCGDGLLHSGESCDNGDANADTADASCRTDCTLQRCGDGVKDTGEQCDDGNTSNADGCLNSCVLAQCGDGYVESGVEECEPPNTVTCQSNCLFRTAGGGGGGGTITSSSSSSTSYYQRPDPPDGCGNAILEAGEECDAGRFNGQGTCSYDCQQLVCGDGVISPQIGEDCEPSTTTDEFGNTIFEVLSCGKICSLPTINTNGAYIGGCKTIFLPACNAGSSSSATGGFTPSQPICGNGTVEVGEECDGQDGCNESCAWNICGDGLVNQEGEQCDNGSYCQNDPNRACRSSIDCAGAECVYAKDADTTCSEECRRLFTAPPPIPSSVCGNGIIQSGEQCDDGNTLSGDGCNVFCRIEQSQEPGVTCGNGILEAGEQCDNGEANSDITPNACRQDCTLSYCGDSVIDSTEQCDNGTRNSNFRADACRTDCKAPRCGDGIIDTGEYCDGGITCRADCTGVFTNTCGNGVLNQNEECDDGNYRNGDGCSAVCQRETGVQGEFVRPAASPRPKVRPQAPVKVEPQKRVKVRPAAPAIPGSQLLPNASLLPIVQGHAPVGATGPTVAIVISSSAGLAFWKKKRRYMSQETGIELDTYDR